jgi:hypothetical protein
MYLVRIKYLFFLIIFFVGILIYKDYGISWDEKISRNYGLVSGNYILKKILPEKNYIEIFSKIVSKETSIENVNKNIPDLVSYTDRAYGVAFELPVTFFEIILNLKDNNIYYFRHFASFFLFFVSLIFFFKIIKNRTNSNLCGLLGCSLIIVHPHIFSHSFFNSKDIPLMSFMIISLYFGFKFISRQNIKYAILFSFFTALAFSTRIIGIIILPCLLFYFFFNTDKKNNMKFIYFSLLILFFTIFFGIITWPFLWENPITNFKYAINYMSHHPWSHKVLFFGERISATNLPWYYIFVMFLFTTPIFIVSLILLSFLYFFYETFCQIKYNKFQSKFFEDFFILCIIFIPIFVAIFLRATIYDSWRHFFFIYPFIIFFIVNFLNNITKYKFFHNLRYLFFSFIIINVFYYFIWSIKNHPHQYVYYNNLYSNKTAAYFEKDYWGVSDKTLINKLIQIKPEGKIYFDYQGSNFNLSMQIIDQKNIDRFIYVGKNQNYQGLMYNDGKTRYKGEYYIFVLNRWDNSLEYHSKNSKKIFEVEIEGTVVNGLYQVKM